MPDDLPPRPTSAAVAAALASIAAGEAFLASVAPDETDHHLQQLDTVSGWRLAIWWRRGEMGPLHSAISPEGLQWTYGCARWPDWLAGPDAVVLDPIRHLLDDEQRQALRRVLIDPVCWPAPDPLPIVAPPPREWTDEELLELLPS